MSLHDSSNPFVGLRPFESDESLLFFGRQEQTLELLQRLHQHHFVAVVGSSGSGKSSLIRAGLIPSLKAGYLVDERDRWVITIMKPGQSPLYNLAEAILNQLKPGTDATAVNELLLKIKEEGSDAVLGAIHQLWEEKNTNFFLLIDQFEELFRFSMEQKDAAKKDEAIDFVNIMLELSQQKNLPVYIVITMRSDFIGDCAQFFGLPEAMNRSQYLVPRLNRVQMKTAIEGPIKLYRGSINAALLSKLLNDVATVRDELPLLQHALMRIWDREANFDKSGELDMKDYEAIGGIEKALSNHADEALEGMSDDELRLTKKIFQALTAIDENGRKIRRPVHLGELKEITGASAEQLLTIINRFIQDKRSFLIIYKVGNENDYMIDISHESLIRQWGTLNGWVEEEVESAKNYLRLVESADLNRENKKDFIGGTELQLALKWCKDYKPMPVWAKRYNKDFNGGMQYLEESEKKWNIDERKKRAAKRNKIILLFSVVAMAFLGVVLKAQQNARESSLKAEQLRIADQLRNDAEMQKSIAQDSAKSASIQRTLAIEKSKEAESLKVVAERNAATAEKQSILARQQASVAKEQNAIAQQALMAVAKWTDAVRLNSNAQEMLKSDPNLALRIADMAISKISNPIFTKAASEIYEQNAFYKTILNNGESAYEAGAVSPVQNNIAIGSNGILRIWSQTGKLIDTFEAHKFSMNQVTFSADGLNIVTVADDNHVKLWEPNGKLLHEFTEGPDNVTAVGVSSNGSKIAIAYNNGMLALWDKDGKHLKDFPEQPSAIRCVAFSPAGDKILTGSADDIARLWKEDGELMQEFKGHTNVINTLAFSEDGKTILTGSADSTAKLWRISPPASNRLQANNVLEKNPVRIDNALLKEFKANGVVSCVAFSPDGVRLLTGSSDGTAKLWNKDGTMLMILRGHNNLINTATFLSNGKILTQAIDGTTRTWNTPANQFIGHSKAINLVAFSPNGTKILTGSVDSTARLWDLNGGSRQVLRDSDQVASVAFSPDNNSFLAASGKVAKLFDINGKLLREFKGHRELVQSVAFWPDGTKIFTASDDSTVRVWKTDGSDPTGKIFGTHNGGAVSVSFSKSRRFVLTSSRDQTATLWTAEGEKIRSFQHDGTVYLALFSPDETKILTCSDDGTAILWNLAGVSLVKFQHRGAIESIAFSPDGTKILTGSHDQTATIWSIDGKPLRTFELPSQVRTVAFSPDGKQVFLGAGDGIGRLYSALTFTEFLKSDEIDPLTEQKKKELELSRYAK